MSLAAAFEFAAEPSATATDAIASASIQMHVRDEALLQLKPKYGSGAVAARVRYTWQGRAGAPTVIVQGGISATRDTADFGATSGWWSDQVRAGGPIDLDTCRVLSIDWLAPADLGAVAGVASDDQADALAALLDHLDIDCASAFVGSSYGAMVGLAFAARHPARVARLVAISGAHRAHPLATALRAIQREIVRSGLANGNVAEALGLARQLAMTTYRGAEEFAERFDGAPQFRAGRFHFPVEDYLSAAGRKFVGRFDAQRYLGLSESIDLHRIDPRTVAVPTDVVAVRSDRLVPADDLADLVRDLGAPAQLHSIDSRYGHDAFLKEPERIAAILRRALAR